MAHDWYRNTDWNEAIAQAFRAKLKRARDKNQYLRIQASTLANSHPQVALQLLDEYFELGDNFDMAQAHVDRATAYLALGDVEAAIGSYEAAMEREQDCPQFQTGAALHLSYVIALNDLSDRFDQALAILPSAAGNLFAAGRFMHHAARAMILSRSEPDTARREARLALEEAALEHSGLRYHPRVGLVSEKFSPALSRLRSLCDS